MQRGGWGRGSGRGGSYQVSYSGSSSNGNNNNNNNNSYDIGNNNNSSRGRQRGGGGRGGGNRKRSHEQSNDGVSTSEYRRFVVHCKKSKFDVYIGRPNPTIANSDCKWGNPFKITNDTNRDQVIQQYREYLDSHPELKAAARRELKGKILACWCSPLSCHGDVLAEVANQTEDEKNIIAIEPINEEKVKRRRTNSVNGD
eukprot:TRINITY_DN2062_c0_g1_i1.p1 TRINITY_DN2062_c0_g1~~TRINITY_DN2062_c0_g1_i1.p1  ORF type:complete len:199 (-),score=52.17 TRINITY_DN2062_c0_g1_i1:271-867(-)